MAKLPAPPTATDDDVRALLARYNCPVPFHARNWVRLRIPTMPISCSSGSRSVIPIDPDQCGVA
jgi:hypothetical protein